MFPVRTQRNGAFQGLYNLQETYDGTWREREGYDDDQFFEADAPAFLDTKRLRDIGVVTDNNIKVVFAGLHSVQRYAKSARRATPEDMEADR